MIFQFLEHSITSFKISQAKFLALVHKRPRTIVFINCWLKVKVLQGGNPVGQHAIEQVLDLLKAPNSGITMAVSATVTTYSVPLHGKYLNFSW